MAFPARWALVIRAIGTVSEVNQISGQYTVDKNKIYTTGQSGGCMMSLALNIKYPELFAASFLVAGQWGAELPPC